MMAVQMHRTGGPEVLEYVELPTPEPGPGEVLVRSESIGIGMPEILVRTGRYAWMPPLPAVPGIEMAGRIAALGADVTTLRVGDPVFVTARELPVRAGCYAEYVKAPAQAVYPLPEGVDPDAAASLCNYQVAWHLLHSATNGFRYDRVLVWAAAGGVGTALVQLAKIAGKRVIGIASGALRCEFVRVQGADACIDRRQDDIGAEIARLTGGAGVDLILDPVGGPQLARNVAWLAPLGLLVNYGQLEGEPDPGIATALRGRFGDSVGLRYFSMHTFDHNRERRRAAMDELVPLLAAGRIRPPIHECLPLSEVQRAHALFDSGAVVGKLILKP
jgi:NADPH2:quinone reductase